MALTNHPTIQEPFLQGVRAIALGDLEARMRLAVGGGELGPNCSRASRHAPHAWRSTNAANN